jgi:uncharacterized SAM-binding protein YcdF (DUF218 family)
MFIISKIIAFFLHPFVWILLLLIAAWISRNAARKKILLRTTLIIFIFFSNGYILKNIWYHYQAPIREMNPGEHYQAAILLGGFVSYDEINHRAFFNHSADRFIQAARLYKQHHIAKIIMTGGNALFVKDKEYNEAEFVVKNLIDFGIPATDILAERKAKNTIDNAVLSGKMLDSAHIAGPYVLITSAIHMPRAEKIFRRAGMDVRPYPCDYQFSEEDTRFSWKNIVPSSSNFDLWNLLLREFMGTLGLRFTMH